MNLSNFSSRKHISLERVNFENGYMKAVAGEERMHKSVAEILEELNFSNTGYGFFTSDVNEN